LGELFSPDDAAEIAYMMNRARRTGLATREFELKRAGQILHIAVTVSSLEREGELGTLTPPGFVIVLEDTTDLLRAQKSAAWSEVARRVAHEIKNPLTPIALSADRMDRLFERFRATDEPEERKRLQVHFEQCTAMITREVENLRSLVDEFAQFARFPAAHPERANLNEVVGTALDVFDGRLDNVSIRTHLSPDLPEVMIDPEHFKRAVVNLIDNAAEAVRACWTKEIIVSTAPGSVPDTVELVVADSGPGISAEDKERHFLPYFSTKKRGTGLGLAIVSRVLAEHQATVRVEDNRPVGTRFIVDLPTADSAVAVRVGANA
jgi:nitrogen fixation/metabolism regulation signal transduction histidine kinase